MRASGQRSQTDFADFAQPWWGWRSEAGKHGTWVNAIDVVPPAGGGHPQLGPLQQLVRSPKGSLPDAVVFIEPGGEPRWLARSHHQIFRLS